MEPKDLTFLKELAIKPTLEEELNIEKRVLEIKATHDIEDLRKYAIGLQRQNMHEQQTITQNCSIKSFTLLGFNPGTGLPDI